VHRPPRRSGPSWLSTGTRGRRPTAALTALTLVTGLLAVAAPLSLANAAGSFGGYALDGVVPDDAAFATYTDPAGNSQELGPKNGSAQQLGVIHNAPKPMLGYTNPNSDSDIRTVWLDAQPVGGKEILYFAWERDASSGSSVILYEFQQRPKPTACDYTRPEPVLVAQCNPWENRSDGDFVIVFDQQGNSVTVSTRTFSGTGSNLVLGPNEPVAAGLVETAMSADRSRGEAAIDLSSTVFAKRPGECVSVANVVAGTITGNSDTADYKDVVLPRTPLPTISSCGTVRVTKATQPTADLPGTFPVTLTRTGGGVVQHPDERAPDETLTGGGDVQTFLDVVAGTDYSLAEAVPPGWDLVSIVCDGKAAPAVFEVKPGTTTDCTVTNRKQTPSLGLTKTASTPSYAASGQTLTYAYRATNTGNVDLQGPLELVDDRIARAGLSCPTVATLAVGASVDCSGTYTTTQADVDAGQVVNTAKATLSFGQEPVTSNEARASVPAAGTSALTLDKSSDVTSYDEVGDRIAYSYVVTNTGTTTLTGLTVVDDKTTVRCPVSSLAPRATTTCTASSTITQADLDRGSLTNVARAVTDQRTSAPDEVTVTVVANPGLTLVKSTTSTGYDEVGDVLAYSYAVRNTGNRTLPGPVTGDRRQDPGHLPCRRAGAGGDHDLHRHLPRHAGRPRPRERHERRAGVRRRHRVRHLHGHRPGRSGAGAHGGEDAPHAHLRHGRPGRHLRLRRHEHRHRHARGPVQHRRRQEQRRGLREPRDAASRPEHHVHRVDDHHAGPPGRRLAHQHRARLRRLRRHDGDVPPDDATVTAVVRRALVLDKTTTATGFDAVGQELPYSYLVTNDGSTTLTGVVTVADDRTSVTCLSVPVTLPPGASTSLRRERHDDAGRPGRRRRHQHRDGLDERPGLEPGLGDGPGDPAPGAGAHQGRLPADLHAGRGRHHLLLRADQQRQRDARRTVLGGRRQDPGHLPEQRLAGPGGLAHLHRLLRHHAGRPGRRLGHQHRHRHERDDDRRPRCPRR
jgi:hypothetical protein